MALKDEGSLITMNRMRVVTGPAITGSTISLSEAVNVPLKPTNNLSGFQRLSGL